MTLGNCLLLLYYWTRRQVDKAYPFFGGLWRRTLLPKPFQKVCFYLVKRNIDWFGPAADPNEVKSVVCSLGLQEQRSKRLIELSKQYVQTPPNMTTLYESRGTYPMVSTPSLGLLRPSCASSTDEVQFEFVQYPPTPISHFQGIGPYALDSYRMFCFENNEWKSVMPSDKELVRYMVEPKSLCKAIWLNVALEMALGTRWV
jgi:hypothetical protein